MVIPAKFVVLCPEGSVGPLKNLWQKERIGLRRWNLNDGEYVTFKVLEGVPPWPYTRMEVESPGSNWTQPILSEDMVRESGEIWRGKEEVGVVISGDDELYKVIWSVGG